jgi:hypothetical protein
MVMANFGYHEALVPVTGESVPYGKFPHQPSLLMLLASNHEAYSADLSALQDLAM